MLSSKRNFQTDTIALKKLALDCGIETCTELARRSGVNRNTLGKIWNGKEQPTSDVMYKLAACLNMSSTQAGLIFFKDNLRIT